MKYISIKQPWIVFVLELKQASKNRKITIYPVWNRNTCASTLSKF
uniref:Uncharacterized protein n=1 Tax=Anguilla anguilla TaxID=7936 RepID=A0A0E9QPJ0_ANGAN